MTTLQADLWTTPCDARCITTNGTIKANGRAVMGRGTALQATAHYPGIRQIQHRALVGWGNVPCILLPDERPMLVSFPVKYDWWLAADLGLIAKSAQALVGLADGAQWQTVLLPRPGCGNGQRTWAEVVPILAPILDDRFVVVSL